MRKPKEKASGLWDPVSDAMPRSSALGLTQFLRDTWLAEAKRKGTLLNEKASALGLDERALLALRRDPLVSITAAAEYALANLAQLAKEGVTPESLTAGNFPLMSKDDAEGNKAKLAYLAHHEGFAGALAVVRGTLKETRAESLLRTNTGKRADELRANAATWKQAYIDWLFGYIRSRIVPAKFVDPAKAGDQTTKPGGGTPSTGKPPPVKAKNPGSSTGPGGTFKLTEAHLIALWKRSGFPIDTRGVIVFGIRGCLPDDVEGTGFATEHAVKFTTVDYKTMKCTIGQWRPGEGFALFPGSTVPFGEDVRIRVKGGGLGINQMGPGRYLNYVAGFHQRKQGRAGHWALLQGCHITIQRTGDDADFDLGDRWEAGDVAGDNIHCAFGMGGKGKRPLSKFSKSRVPDDRRHGEEGRIRQ